MLIVSLIRNLFEKPVAFKGGMEILTRTEAGALKSGRLLPGGRRVLHFAGGEFWQPADNILAFL